MSFWGIQAGLSGETTDAVSISNKTGSSLVAGGPATAGYRLNSSGTAEATSVTAGNAYVAISLEWLVYGSAGDYESFMHQDSGDALTSGTMDTWQVLSSTRTWTLVGSGSDLAASCTLQIRRASDSVVLDTATITFEALGAP
jgi:hypothetical protein